MKEKIIHRKDNPLLFLPTSFFFLCAQVHVWDYQVYMCTSACVELTVNCIYIFCFCFHLIVLHCFLSLIFLPRTTNSSLNLMKEVFFTSFSNTLGTLSSTSDTLQRKILFKKDSDASSQENNKPYLVIRVQIMHVFKNIFEFYILIRFNDQCLHVGGKNGRKNL